MLGLFNIENKINLTFHRQVKSQRRVFNRDLTKYCIKEFIYKVEGLLYLLLHVQTKKTLVKLCTD